MKYLVSQKNLFMSLKEAERILSAIPESEQHYRLLLLLVAHGCRPCEAVRLHLSDFCDDTFTRFYVSNSKVVRKGQPPRRDLRLCLNEGTKKETVTGCRAKGLLLKGSGAKQLVVLVAH